MHPLHSEREIKGKRARERGRGGRGDRTSEKVETEGRYVNKLKITIRSAFLNLQWSREFIQTHANAAHKHTHTHTWHLLLDSDLHAILCFFEAEVQISDIPRTHSERGGGRPVWAASASTHVLCVLHQASCISISALQMCKISPDLRLPHLPSLPPPSCPSKLLICVPQPSAQTN